MIVIVGDSCAGKSTIEKELVKRGYNKITSYTTRPIRPGETPDTDYHFVTKDEFQWMVKNDKFAEHTNYSMHSYGVAIEDCTDDAIVVVEPTGLRQLKKRKDLNIISFYIEAPENIRMMRMMMRGDDLTEAYHRIVSDRGTFSGIRDEIDYVVPNGGLYPVENAVDYIQKILKANNIWKC